MIKNGKSNKECKIYHGDLWGLRERKYKWLLSNDITTTDWEEIHPHSKLYFFLPKEEKYRDLYNKYWILNYNVHATKF